MYFKMLSKQLVVLLTSSVLAVTAGSVSAADTSATPSIDQVAETYVRLGLAFRQHDRLPSYYFGPKALQQEVEQNPLTLDQISQRLEQLQAELAALPATSDSLKQQRRRALAGRLKSMSGRIDIVQGVLPASFDAEVEQMYGVSVPRRTEQDFLALINKLEELIPGEGDLSERVARFRDKFVIPVDRLETVIGAALAECRKQTLEKINFPGPEQATLHLVTDKPWVGFLHYQGQGNSMVLLNKDVPIHLERAIELGCHEAYPGHHAHATMMDQVLVQQYGWQEYTLIPLFGPQAIIAEGVASYAEDLVFSEQERLQFETQTLLPLAGLDASQLAIYNRYREIKHELIYAWNEVARRYLYEGMNKDDAIKWLQKYGLETEATATQRLNFISSLRAYVVSYNYGRDLVREYIERESRGDEGLKWEIYQQLISNPVLPADLRQN
ncbi:TPA: hypothetical protein L4G24_001964 [Pseudomonas aeruginosa]|nr:hypothetical protein [Pseudomonas fluorescens]HBO1995410.1 hypothetical protein [Pseudomonas aeruginosa]